jgi:hypothetical protein
MVLFRVKIIGASGKTLRQQPSGATRRHTQMTEVNYDGLLARLTKLERQNRLWKIAGLLMLLGIAFSLTANVTAQQANWEHMNPPTPPITLEAQTLEARTFELKDSAGIMRGKMTVDGDRHPLLEFYDLDGKVIWSTNAHAIPTK